MDSGAPGQRGRLVQKHAAKENKEKRAPAQTHRQLMEENNAQAKLRRLRIAIINHVQVCYGVIHSFKLHMLRCDLSPWQQSPGILLWVLVIGYSQIAK